MNNDRQTGEPKEKKLAEAEDIKRRDGLTVSRRSDPDGGVQALESDERPTNRVFVDFLSFNQRSTRSSKTFPISGTTTSVTFSMVL